VNQISKNRYLILGLTLLIPTLIIIHLFSGKIEVSLSDYFSSLFSYDESVSEQIIARNIRIPRMIMAVIAGAGLALSGLLMQTLFTNPLAGPYVLGINSGASLFVALFVMTGVQFFASDIGIIANALIGSFVFGLVILSFSKFVKNQISLLLIGIMLGSFTSAFISIIQTHSNANQLKVFTLWSLGSLQKVNYNQLPLIITVFIIGSGLAFFLIKPLNILIQGETEARLLGLKLKSLRIKIICITSILVGLITAFCGPVAFIGMAVPNLVRILFKTQQHRVLIVASLLLGAGFVLLCDIIIQLIEHQILIPLNAITSIIGAPLVVLIVLKRIK
jgi:iron complex transport system permease protein